MDLPDPAGPVTSWITHRPILRIVSVSYLYLPYHAFDACGGRWWRDGFRIIFAGARTKEMKNVGSRLVVIVLLTAAIAVVVTAAAPHRINEFVVSLISIIVVVVVIFWGGALLV